MKTPQAEHRFVSLLAQDVLQGIDLAALFGETLWTLSLAKTSARLPEGLSVDDCGMLGGVVPALAAPLVVQFRSGDARDERLRVLEIMVRSLFALQCAWDGPRLRLTVTQNLLAQAAPMELTWLTVGSCDMRANVRSQKVRLMRGPDGAYVTQTPLRAGTPYLLSYDIPENDGVAAMILADGTGGPVAGGTLPVCPGTNRVFFTPDRVIRGTLFTTQGPAVPHNVTCQQAGWSVAIPDDRAGEAVIWRVQSGSTQVTGTTQVRRPGALYVAPDGENAEDRGGPDTPFRHPGYALKRARPGDTIYLRPGFYPAFVVSQSGTAQAPITITTLPGEERQAIVSGADDLTGRLLAGITVEGQSHIAIKNLTIQDMQRSGIYVLGRAGMVHRGFVLSGNLIRRTGNAAIFVAGYRPHQTLGYDDVRLHDVLIEHNDISETNMPVRYNKFRGGVNECISVAAGVDGVITRHNDIHDSRQYGVDYKLGVRNGQIYANRIWNIEKYGIYLDAARRYVENVDVFDNVIFRCGLGITLAREAVTKRGGAAQMNDLVQTLRNINVYNNLIYDIARTGIYCHYHPKDRPEGEISGIRIRFNTIVNCATSGVGNEVRLVGWTNPDWAGVLEDFDFVGNILWRPGVRAGDSFHDRFSGAPGVVIAQNLVGVDPQFTGPQDFTLSAGSPARDLVAARFAAAPFGQTAGGKDRGPDPDAGAF